MDIFIKTTRISSINNKYQIGDSFITDEIKVKIAPLEWDDLVLQEQLKSLMYVDHSIRGDQMKDKLIDELNFKSCMSLRENKRSKLFIGITSKKEFYYSS